MPRSNRPRRSRQKGSEEEPDLSGALFGHTRTEVKRDGRWTVQSLSAAASAKDYTCPGCGIGIAAGTAHIVAWRADGLMGEAEDIAARRHWHSHCWKIK